VQIGCEFDLLVVAKMIGQLFSNQEKTVPNQDLMKPEALSLTSAWQETPIFLKMTLPKN
jgi:hypothetical protein